MENADLKSGVLSTKNLKNLNPKTHLLASIHPNGDVQKRSGVNVYTNPLDFLF